MNNTLNDLSNKLSKTLSNLFNTLAPTDENVHSELFYEAVKISIYEFFKPQKYESLKLFYKDGFPWAVVRKGETISLYKIIPSINRVNSNPLIPKDEDTLGNVEEAKVIYVNFYTSFRNAMKFENSVKGQAIIGYEKYYFGEIKIGNYKREE